MLAENYMRTHTHSRIKGNDAISDDPREKNESIYKNGFSWVETVPQDRTALSIPVCLEPGHCLTSQRCSNCDFQEQEHVADRRGQPSTVMWTHVTPRAYCNAFRCRSFWHI